MLAIALPMLSIVGEIGDMGTRRRVLGVGVGEPGIGGELMISRPDEPTDTICEAIVAAEPPSVSVLLPMTKPDVEGRMTIVAGREEGPREMVVVIGVVGAGWFWFGFGELEAAGVGSVKRMVV